MSRGDQPLPPKVEAQLRRIAEIWHGCIAQYGGPFLFGSSPCAADAFYGAPNALLTSAVALATSPPPAACPCPHPTSTQHPVLHTTPLPLLAAAVVAPVAARLFSYDVPLPADLPLAAAYVATILSHPAVQRWYAESATSTPIGHYDAASTAVGPARAVGVGRYDAAVAAKEV